MSGAVITLLILLCNGRLGVQGEGGLVPLKLMARHPRGTTVKEHHGLASLKGVQFAEQLQVRFEYSASYYSLMIESPE